MSSAPQATPLAPTAPPVGELPAFDPVPRQRIRHDGWTEQRQRGFIEALADTGSVKDACRAVGMTTVGAYALRRQPGAESFRAAWDAALDCGVRLLEASMMDRAINGVEVPVLSAGKSFGTRRVFNERVALLILQSRMPEKYGMQRARAMSGLDKQRLARLKAQWREELVEEIVEEIYPELRELAEANARAELESEMCEALSMRGVIAGYHAAQACEQQMSPAVRVAYEAYHAAVQAEKAKGAPASGPLWRHGWEITCDREAERLYDPRNPAGLGDEDAEWEEVMDKKGERE